MSYLEVRPDPQLEGWVASLRFSSDEDAAGARRVHRVVPDGGVDLLVSVPSRSGELQAEVFGIKSKPRLVGGDGPRENAAIHFRPGAASRFLGVPAHALVDRCVDLAAIWGDAGAELAARVAEAPTAAARGRILEEALVARSAPVRAQDAPRWRLVDAAVARIEQTRGCLPIEDLAAELGVGERRLERVFREEVGLAPKRFSRIVRFDAALAALEAGRPQIEVALACGYSDQPHLQRDFRELAGVSPGVCLAEAVGFVQAGPGAGA